MSKNLKKTQNSKKYNLKELLVSGVDIEPTVSTDSQTSTGSILKAAMAAIEEYGGAEKFALEQLKRSPSQFTQLILALSKLESHNKGLEKPPPIEIMVHFPVPNLSDDKDEEIAILMAKVDSLERREQMKQEAKDEGRGDIAAILEQRKGGKNEFIEETEPWRDVIKENEEEQEKIENEEDDRFYGVARLGVAGEGNDEDIMEEIEEGEEDG